MKFICPSCKAKYQIADERVQGRSVKMKCRNCGYLIQISRADGVSSDSGVPLAGSASSVPASEGDVESRPSPLGHPTALSSAPSSSRVAAQPARQPDTRGAPTTAAPRTGPVMSPFARAPGAATVSREPPAKPSQSGPSRPGEKPALSRPIQVGPVQAKDVLPKPPGASLPKPAGLRPTAKSTTASSDPQSRPGAFSPPRPQAPAPGARSAPVASSPTSTGAGRPIPSRTGAAEAAPIPSEAPTDADRWRPQKPLGDLALGGASVHAGIDFATHRKPQVSPAAVGSANRQSALAGAFSHALSGSAAAALDELKAPAEEWYVGINNVPVGPVHVGHIRSKAAVGAVTLSSLVWKEGLEEWQPLKSFPELSAIVEESISSARAAAMAVAAAEDLGSQVQPGVRIQTMGEVSDPFALPVPAVGAAGAPTAEELEVAGLARARGTSLSAWFALVVALLFGLTIGWWLFSGQKQKTIVQYVEVAASNKTLAQAAPESGSGSVTSDDEPTAVASTGRRTAKPSAVAATEKPADQGDSTSKGLKGLQGLHRPTGPEGPSGAAARVTGGQQLDPAQVQRTVSKYTGSVKRSCWQPALDARDQDAPTSARVTVSITVGVSGSVDNVTTSGDPKGYRGLANCIASRVRGWQFPPSSSPTTVNVPFVFAAQ